MMRRNAETRTMRRMGIGWQNPFALVVIVASRTFFPAASDDASVTPGPPSPAVVVIKGADSPQYQGMCITHFGNFVTRECFASAT